MARINDRGEKKKRNPQDTTLINLRALKKRVDALEGDARLMCLLYDEFEKRISALERRSPIRKFTK